MSLLQPSSLLYSKYYYRNESEIFLLKVSFLCPQEQLFCVEKAIYLGFFLNDYFIHLILS